MLRVGKIFEELHQLDSARAQYRRLAARYPGSDAAEDARFRIPWTLYLARNYRAAAPMTSRAPARARRIQSIAICASTGARARWKRPAIRAGARAIFEKLADSTDSNYYPELASRRVAASHRIFPRHPRLILNPAGLLRSAALPSTTWRGCKRCARLGLKELRAR